MVLGEVARVRLVPPGDGAGVGRELSHADLEQGRLADAVRPDDREAVAAANVEGDVAQHLVVAEGLRDPLEAEHLLAAGTALTEAKGRVAPRRLRQPIDRDALDLLDLALRLAGLGVLGAETVDECLVLGDLFLALGDLGLAPLALRLFGLDEGGVVAGVEGHRLVVDVEDVRRDVVQEAVVVGDHHRAAGEAGQELLEPPDGQDVEVVGGLVEQQALGIGGQRLREQHSQPEAAGQGRQGIAVEGGRDAEPLEDLGRARLEGIAVMARDDVFEIGVAVAVEARVGAIEQRSLVTDRLPQLVVAHHRHLEDRQLLEAVVVLLEGAQPEPPRLRHSAGARLLLAGEDPQERRLARAVGPDQPVAAAGVELEAHVLEQRLRAVPLGEAGDRDHGRTA